MKRFLSIVAGCALALSSTALAADQLLAFPGAEGFGRYATGGRGGEIYHVTNLNDAGPGSLRDAVSQSNRIIIFDVCGTINLKSTLIVKGNNTILGQTAPGEGIQVYGNRVSFSGANNLIVRHMRFRMGIGGDSGKDAAGVANGHDMIFDHMSVLWGRDECFSISSNDKTNGPKNITIQNSIIGQGLQSHSCGGLMQSDNGITLYRNLYIENKTRNPKVKGLNQYVNNVVYNWGGGGCYIMSGSEGDSFADIENNYFMKGPWNGSTNPFTRGTPSFRYYGAGNYYDNDKDGTINGHLMTVEEMKGESGDGIAPYSTWFESLAKVNEEIAAYNAANSRDIQAIPEIVNKMSAADALNWVSLNAGASLPVSDEVDLYLLDELRSWGTVGTKNGITSEKQLPHKGTGILSGGVKPLDTDGDGIPDAWERANGLNPNDASDAKAIAANGYANIENYVFTITEAYPYIKKPVNFAVTNQGKTSLSFSWELNKNTTEGFVIEYAANGGNYTETAMIPAGTTEYTLNGLTENTPYAVRLRSVKADRSIVSDYSETLNTETIGDPAAPSQCTTPFPADGSREAVAAGVIFKWENTTKNYFGTVNYSFYLGTDASALELKKEGLTATSYKVEDLQAGKTYYWRVDARNDVGTTTGKVWSFTATAGGVLFYTDFHTAPAAWASKYGDIADNTNVINAANTTAEFDGMVIGTGADAIRIIAMSAANNSADGSKDYGPATPDDEGASDRCLQFYTTKAGGYVMTPSVTGPCVVTIYAGNPDKSSKTFKLNTIVNGTETTVSDLTLGAAKKVYKFQYTYNQSGTVQFKIDANAKKININDIIVERYVAGGGDQPLELTSGNLVNDNLSYADGSITLTFNQDIAFNGKPQLNGGEQFENVTASASGKKLTVNYEALNVNTSYTVRFPEGAITSSDGTKSYVAELKLNTCDFPPLKQSGETHFGKAAKTLPLNFAPFTAVAPFETEGGLVQTAQNDYPHWVQASGEITDASAEMTKTSDKIMVYYGPSSAKVSLKVRATGNYTLKVLESRNCDIAPGWRTICVYNSALNGEYFETELPLNPESHFVKLLPSSVSGSIKIEQFRLSDSQGFFGDDYIAGITEVTVENLAVEVNGNELSVAGAPAGAEIRVYDVAGRLAGSAVAADGTAEFTLTNGLYILSVGNHSLKVRI